MPITRDQARRVLSQPEMGLFGDSRNPALRALSEKALASRVARTRKLRDKARDLLQRQKLKSRERTGSKLGDSGEANQRTDTKGNILDDILQRFETRLQEVQAAPEPAVRKAGKPKAGVPARKTATRTTASERKATQAKKTARQPAVKPASTTGKTAAARSKTGITAKGALDNTRALLEAKQQRERQPPAYLEMDTQAGTEQPSPGFQSGTAKSKALELHEGEMRMEPIHGSISTHNRRNQGNRDKR